MLLFQVAGDVAVVDLAAAVAGDVAAVVGVEVIKQVGPLKVKPPKQK